MMSLPSCIHINEDWLDYIQRQHITVSTDSLREIKLWRDQLICCPDAQPEGVYRLSRLTSTLGLTQGHPPPPDRCLDGLQPLSWSPAYSGQL